VRKQFGQIFTVVVIVFMDIVQEKDQPFPVINSVCLAATKHGVHNGSILSSTMVPAKHPVFSSDSQVDNPEHNYPAI
jgi:hypothetical protein